MKLEVPDELKPLPKEIVAEPVTAWRMWKIVPPQAVTLGPELVAELEAKWERGENPFKGLCSPRLCGVGHHVTWPRNLHASCAAGDTTQMFWSPGGRWATSETTHAAPAQGCNCGVWGFKSRESIMEAMAKYRQGDAPYAFGRVLLWGRIIEHANGYRAEHGRPISLNVIADADTARQLGEFYGCMSRVVAEPPRVNETRQKWAEQTAEATRANLTAQLAAMNQWSSSLIKQTVLTCNGPRTSL